VSSPPLRLPWRLGAFREVITDAPVSYSIYSAFSYYGERCGGELPGPWLVRAIGQLGHATAAIRQTLYRMEGTRELDSRLQGRTKFYRLTPTARAEMHAGLAKIMPVDVEPWDGRWTVVHVARGSDDSVDRERLLDIVRAEGFALIGSGLYLHPRDRASGVTEAAEQSGVRGLLEVFRAARIGSDAPRDVVARYWDLSGLSTQYDRFVARYRPLLTDRRALQPAMAFVIRFAVVFDFLETAWSDPMLAPELLPNAWSGHRAQRTAQRLYERLLPGAMVHADHLMAEVGLPIDRHTPEGRPGDATSRPRSG
jgi:phenylacetic acid degradation operon negative regulatory protein